MRGLGNYGRQCNCSAPLRPRVGSGPAHDPGVHGGCRPALRMALSRLSRGTGVFCSVRQSPGGSAAARSLRQHLPGSHGTQGTEGHASRESKMSLLNSHGGLLPFRASPANRAAANNDRQDRQNQDYATFGHECQQRRDIWLVNIWSVAMTPLGRPAERSPTNGTGQGDGAISNGLPRSTRSALGAPNAARPSSNPDVRPSSDRLPKYNDSRPRPSTPAPRHNLDGVRVPVRRRRGQAEGRS